jgi:ribose transport system ATP-binding protein
MFTEVTSLPHRLDEVLAVADRVTVFRDGKWIDTTDIAKTSITEIIMKMVGREVGSIAAAAARKSDQPLEDAAPEAMRVEGLSNAFLGNINLTLRAGEVLGVGGLAGSGRTELARAIIGADPIDKGQIWIEGEKVTLRTKTTRNCSRA